MATSLGTPRPYGNSFLIQTPYLDRLGAMMINDQKTRQAQEQQKAAALDNEFAKNVAGIRDADVPGLTEDWATYKAAKQSLYKNGNKMKDADRIAADMDAQRKLGNVYQRINASKARKAEEDKYAGDVIKNPNIYNENAHDVLLKARALPITQLAGNGYDYTDIPANIQYQRGTTDFSKEFNGAVGKATKIGESEPVILPGGLQSQKTFYNGLPSTAPQIAQNFIQSVVGSKKTADLVKEHPELMDDNVTTGIDAEYDKIINSDAYKAAYKGKTLDFPEWMKSTPQGKVAMYLAKQAVINNPPTTTLDKPYDNKNAIQNRKDATWLAHNKLTFAQSMAKIAANKNTGIPENTGYISDSENAENGENVNVPPVIQQAFGIPTNNDGTIRVVYTDKVDPPRMNMIIGRDVSKKQMGVQPISIPQPNGTSREGYIVTPTGDWMGANKQIISREGAKDRYINAVSPTKFKTQVGTKASENTTDNKPTVHTGYSRAELKAGGWKDAQIDQAAKAGKIKLN